MTINRGLYQGEVVPGSLPFGVYEAYNQNLNNLSLSAGANTRTGTAVPSGELWVISHIFYNYVGTPPTYITVIIYNNVLFTHISANRNVVSGDDYNFYPLIVLPPGWFVQFDIAGATLNDDLFASVNGYKMRITS